MSYAATSDFIALLRRTTNGARFLEMPGLDFVLAAFARASAFQVWVGQTPPTTGQPTTLWLKPAANNSWAQESTVYIFNAATAQYELATPQLWAALITNNAGSTYVFQKINATNQIVGNLVTLAAVQRVAPALTAIQLPSVGVRAGRVLRISDWSTNVVGHQIQIVPALGETIMQRTSVQGGFSIFSTADQLAGVTLAPSVDLAGWAIG